MGRYSLRRTEGSPGFVAAAIVAVCLAAFFGAAGLFSPVERPGATWSPREIIGVVLMLIAVPTYLLVAWTIGHRRSLELVDELRPLLPDPAQADRAREAIATGWRRTWPIGTAIGFCLSLFNTQPLWALFEAPYPRVAIPISLGQIALWTTIGNVFVARLAASNAFAQLGEHVRVDVFRVDRLRPLARAGVVDAAIFMGALLFVPLQSLDFEFRPENYRFALAVAVPAIAFYVVWPLRSVHRRIRADRDARFAGVDRQLEALGTEPPATPDETECLEQLLAHRERLREARVWPLDLQIASRVFIYLIIPPLAWAAAAIVERFVDAMLAGS